MLVLKIKRLNGQLNEMGNSKVDTMNMISKHADDKHIKMECSMPPKHLESNAELPK
jgi:hypothetical protein